jgi:hypothetical protein
VVQPLGDAGQMSESFLNVVRTFFEDLSTLILGELPPLSTFSDRDERCANGFASADSGLF